MMRGSSATMSSKPRPVASTARRSCDLVRVLHQAQLGNEARELVIGLEGEVVVGARERIDVGRRESEVGGDRFEGGARTDPELADGCVGVELGRRAIGALAQVQGHVVTALDGFEDQDGVGHGVGAPAGQVREGGVGTERVVGVVRALLEGAGGDDQARPRERGRDGGSTCGGVGGFGSLRRQGGGPLGPSGRDRLEEARGEGLLAVRGRCRRGLGGLLGDGVALVGGHLPSLAPTVDLVSPPAPVAR